jgi:hypothetical protein
VSPSGGEEIDRPLNVRADFGPQRREIFAE